MGEGTDGRTVVGPDLRVHGTTNLRVADACIFPNMIGVNPNITCMAIGEHAAQLLHSGDRG
jgi:choline dehydrogenase-like flavoprotein